MKSYAALMGCFLLAIAATFAGCSDTNMPTADPNSEPPPLEALPTFSNAWATDLDAMAVDTSGIVHTSKMWNSEIISYSATGEIVSACTPQLGGVAVRPVYLSECGGYLIVTCDSAGKTWFAKFDWRHNSVLSWQDHGRREGGYPFYWNPIATDRAGRIYVLDWDRELVTLYDRDALMIRSWHPIGASPQFTNVPQGIAVGPNGVVYIIVNYSVLMYNSAGTLLGEVTPGDTRHGYRLAADGLAIDSAGALYLVDRIGRRIVKTDAAGHYVGEFSTGSDNPMPAYVGVNGRSVFVACCGFYDESGVVMRYVYGVKE